MPEGSQNEGVAVLCDRLGVVQCILRDDLGVSARLSPGACVVQMADPADGEKAAQFLSSLQRLQAAFDWEMAVPCGGELATLHFTGGQVTDGFLVVAARSRDGVAAVNEDLMRINNEQTNALRTTAKELAFRSRLASSNESRIYEELTRVNNDLSNLQRELFRKNRELAALNEQMNQFLSMAAHDLRSPLGVIQNYSEFLEDTAGPELKKQQRHFLGTIRRVSESMLRMINDLLDVTHFDSGNLKMELQPVDLAEVVNHALEMNRAMADKKQIRLAFCPETPLPPLLLDRGKIEQVLNNLLSNALKFSHGNTGITVRLSRSEGDAAITITDQGQGIPEDEFSKLFKPFSRTRVKSTAGEPSTGLGLAIVRRIVEGHGGRVEVESRVGEGSTFCVYLPGLE